MKKGKIAEQYFQKLLEGRRLSFEFKDHWYDYLVMGKIKVEIKSCCLHVKHSTNRYMFGRFDFTDSNNLKLQRNEDVWICFIVRHNYDCIVLGFMKSLWLPKKRYHSLPSMKVYHMLQFEEWIDEVKNE